MIKNSKLALIFLVVTLPGFFLFGGFLFAQTPLLSSILMISKDLKFGDRGEAVLRLQQILNSDPETLVSSQGPGSKGLETDYFGPATLSAVIRFQEKYASEVLLSLGLSRGTGFVGSKTRAKLNSISSTARGNDGPGVVSVSPTLNQPKPSVTGFSGLQTSIFSNTSELFTGFISSYSGLPGTKITLSGSGFTAEDNTVNFGKYKISKLPSLNNTITFTVPSTIPIGRYDVFVSNKKGQSTDKTFFVVLSLGTLPPKITSISPAHGVYGEEITIHGENFTSLNEIRSGYGIISDLKSKDGKTITFKVEPFPDTLSSKTRYNDQELEWPIDFYVVNSNGVSEKSGRFVLRI